MAFGFTYTLPTIASSHTDFPVLLKAVDFPSAAIDGTANAIDNGGGNLRAYTSSAKTTQLAVDVVTFVSSGSPEAEVWVKIPIAATSNTIFIEADAVESSQPAVGAAFGRNVVWTDPNYINVYHMNEDPTGTIVDSSGSGNDGTESGGMVSGDLVTGQIGGGLTFNDSGKNFNVSTSIISTGTISIWVKPFFNVDPSDTYWAVTTTVGGQLKNLGMKTFSEENWQADHRGDFGATITLRDAPLADLPSQFYHLATTWDSDNDIYNLYVDGELEINSTATTGNISVGSLRFASGWDGILDEGRVSTTIKTRDWINTEYNNQVSITAWGTVGAWADEVVGEWTGIILGVTNPAKINGILVANIIKVNGIT